jgi:hypothetical protein
VERGQRQYKRRSAKGSGSRGCSSAFQYADLPDVWKIQPGSPRSLVTRLTSLHAPTPAPCELGEVFGPVPVIGCLAPETAREEPERAEPHSNAPGAQEGVQRRSWWRRIFRG